MARALGRGWGPGDGVGGRRRRPPTKPPPPRPMPCFTAWLHSQVSALISHVAPGPQFGVVGGGAGGGGASGHCEGNHPTTMAHPSHRTANTLPPATPPARPNHLGGAPLPSLLRPAADLLQGHCGRPSQAEPGQASSAPQRSNKDSLAGQYRYRRAGSAGGALRHHHSAGGGFWRNCTALHCTACHGTTPSEQQL